MKEISFDELNNNLSLYRSIDLRILAIIDNNDYRCIFLLIKLSREKVKRIREIHKQKNYEFSFKNSKYAEIVFTATPIKNFDSIIDNLRKGFVEIKNRRYILKNEKLKEVNNIKFNLLRDTSNINDDKYNYLESHILTQDSLTPIERVNKTGNRLLKIDNSSIPRVFDLNDFFNRHIIFECPIYCTIHEQKENNNHFLIINIHKYLFKKSEIWYNGRKNDQEIEKRLDKFDIENSDNFKKITIDLTEFLTYSSLEFYIIHQYFEKIARKEIERLDLSPSIFDYQNFPSLEKVNQNVHSDLLNHLLINYRVSDNSYYIKFESGEFKLYPTARSELIKPYQFNDWFYDKLIDEINLLWKLGTFSSTLILVRKLIENMIFDILKKKFPPKTDTNQNLYYNKNKKRRQDFIILIGNLEKKKNKFGMLESNIDETLNLVKPLREPANATTHSLSHIPTEDEMIQFNINKLIQLLKKIKDDI